MLDGLNEKGLGVGTFWFPGFAGYTTATADNQGKSLSPTDFPNWLLTQFATVDEVKAAVANVVITPTVLKNWGPTPPPMHYLVSDKSGKSIVIEPVNGVLKVYDNPLGVLTNSPGFEWHMTNLRNFVSLTTINAKPVTINGVSFEGFGQGTGLTGLPGDFSPPSRFVRATIFQAAAIPVATSDDGVFQAFHILNQFDIPVGSIRETIDGKEFMDYTIMTVVRNAQASKYYIRTFADQNIRVIDLTKFDLDAKDIKKASTAGAQQVSDITANLK
jgi:choloylglycine hydrolase